MTEQGIDSVGGVGIMCGDGMRVVVLHHQAAGGHGGAGASFFQGRGVTQFVTELPLHLATARRLGHIGVEAHG